MARQDQYKLYQVSSIFISRYGFSQIVLDRYKDLTSDEAWLIHPEDEHFHLVRISFYGPEDQEEAEDRIKDYVAILREKTGKQISFLDIHITRESFKEKLPYAVLSLEEGYADGEDVHAYYPEIYEAIHKVENEDKEIFALAQQMRKALIERHRKLLKQKRPVYTYWIMAICIILYLVTYALSLTYDFNSVLVFLGANYSTFTLGLYQFYRLILCGFLHGGLLHLATNMYSLYFMGSYVERKYGAKRYMIMLLVSILTGSLSQSIMSGNALLCGISGALYAFMVVFILDSLKANRMNFYNLIPLLLVNLSINFMSSTAWLAHLGGMISGYLLYLIYDGNDRRGPILLTIVMIALLFLKYVTNYNIRPFYAGTDMEVVRILKDLGFKGYAAKLTQKLLELYNRYGG